MMITGQSPGSHEEFIAKIMRKIEQGITLIQLRAKHLNQQDYLLLARQVLEATQNLAVKIMLNGDYTQFSRLTRAGVHLSSERLMALKQRPFGQEIILSAACHNLQQLKKAEALGINFVTLSPVLATTSHPEAQPLGWPQFSELCHAVQIPVYALGGMSAQHLAPIKAAGAYGYAAISALWDEY